MQNVSNMSFGAKKPQARNSAIVGYVLGGLAVVTGVAVACTSDKSPPFLTCPDAGIVGDGGPDSGIDLRCVGPAPLPTNPGQPGTGGQINPNTGGIGAAGGTPGGGVGGTGTGATGAGAGQGSGGLTGGGGLLTGGTGNGGLGTGGLGNGGFATGGDIGVGGSFGNGGNLGVGGVTTTPGFGGTPQPAPTPGFGGSF